MSRSITIPKYNSATGEGTLSHVSRSHGVTVDQILKANQGNSAVKSRDLIIAGGTLNLPDSGVQQSTTSLRQETEKRNTEFDKKQQEQAQRESEAQEDKTSFDTTDADKDIKDEGTKYIEKVERDYGRIERQADQIHRQMMQGIKQTYRGRIESMKDSNDRLVKLQEALGNRQGRSRYSPIHQAGILTDEEMDGHERVLKIEGEMLSATAKAAQARAEGKFANLNAMYDRIDEKVAEMNTQIEANFDRAIETDKQIQAAAKAEREALESEFDMAMEKSERVAPAVAEALNGFSTDAEKQAFLESYSAKTGIPIDVLTGDISMAQTSAKKDSLDIEKKEADIANTKNTIYNRNRDTDSKIKNRDDEDEQISDFASNILSGNSSYADIDEDNSDFQTVKKELSDYGMFDAKPPKWFLEEWENKAQANPTEAALQSSWDKYKKERGII